MSARVLTLLSMCSYTIVWITVPISLRISLLSVINLVNCSFPSTAKLLSRCFELSGPMVCWLEHKRDSWGISSIPGRKKEFFYLLPFAQVASGAHPASRSIGSVSRSPGLKRSKHEANNLIASPTKVKNEWSWISIFPHSFTICTGICLLSPYC
jgi:hypothetical protein